MTRLHGVGWARHGRSSPTTASCGSGRCRRSSSSGGTSGSTAACAPRCPTSACSPRRADAGGTLVRGRTAQLCGEHARARARSRGDGGAALPRSCARWQQLSWGELSEQVAALAAGLRSLGVQRGDRVAAYMPNIPETLIAFLASASIGAIWSCAAPEFGARSVVDRFAQIEPKVLFISRRLPPRGQGLRPRGGAPDDLGGRCPRSSTR